MLPVGAENPCEDDVFQHPLNNSDPVFQTITGQLRQVRVLRADFSQTKQLKALRRPLLSAGTFLFAAEQGIYWRTQTPFHNVFVISPNTILQQAEGQKPIRIDVAERPIVRGFTDVFLSLFAGETQGLEKRFELYFSGRADAWTLGLKPKGAILEKLIDRVVLCGGDTVRQIQFIEATGDRTLIQFSQVKSQPSELSEEERAHFSR